jgi:NAD(P)-dependent dehydrogenase (short-subunit alcohol dehydrogenase family)
MSWARIVLAIPASFCHVPRNETWYAASISVPAEDRTQQGEFNQDGLNRSAHLTHFTWMLSVPRKVLVTARGSRIGKHTAAAFYPVGCRCVYTRYQRGCVECCGSGTQELKTGVSNVGDRALIEHMVADAAKQLGGIEVLVQQRRHLGPDGAGSRCRPDQWEQVLKVNLTGTFIVTKNAVPHLIRSGNGVIINMSTAAGRFGYPNRSPYATVKWGLIGFTKTLSMELGEHHIRANAVLPGAVDGDRIQRVFEGRAKATEKSLDEIKAIAMENQSIKRLIDPNDIAALAVFLASDAAKSISGQSLPIDADMPRN